MAGWVDILLSSFSSRAVPQVFGVGQRSTSECSSQGQSTRDAKYGLFLKASIFFYVSSVAKFSKSSVELQRSRQYT